VKRAEQSEPEVAASESLVSVRVGERYRTVSEIARGGMGIVYRAVDEASGHGIALKQLLSERAHVARNLALFEREYQTLKSISHPRIIRVLDYGRTAEGPYYTMELLDGHDLHARSRRPYREVCGILRDVATSLSLLHVRRLVHRDITPRNIRLTTDGHAKLLDFGALAPFGISREVIGTAPFVPPEALLGQPLDQRSDLYSLGALAYWLLTGEHAYPANRLEQLHGLWSSRLSPPSKKAPDVPPELERLVMSLLAYEPNARPLSAAEVIDRLNVIADLEKEDAADVNALAHAYLQSAPLVGRETQLALANNAITEAAAGAGRALLVEAGPGMGRTRFLSEVSITAQMLGATVLSVDAGGSEQPLSTAYRLVDRLLDAAQQTALSLIGNEVDLMAGLHPSLAARLGAKERVGLVATPGQWRAELHALLFKVLLGVSDSRLLVIAVDNVDRADEASVALLAALAEETSGRSLLLLLSRTPSAPHDPQVLRALSERSERMELSALDHSASSVLMHAIFGDAPNLVRFSEWLHAATSGSPMYSVELMHQLLDRRVIRFEDAMWTLPAERPDIALPKGLEEALRSRVDDLSPGARKLAEAFAVRRGSMSLDLCAGLAEQQGEVNVHKLLDELTQAGVLTDDGQGYRFKSDAARAALLGAMSDDRKQERHRELAELLLRSRLQLDVFVRLEIGRHLMEGGELDRGADMIFDLAVATSEAERLIDGLQAFVPVVARALDVYEKRGASIYEQIPLTSFLISCAYYVDFRWGTRYGGRAIEMLERAACLPIAKRLAPVLGKKLSLGIALACAFILFKVRRPRRVKYPFSLLLEQVFSSPTTLAGSAAVLLDIDTVRRTASVLEPFDTLAKNLTPAGARDYAARMDLPLTDRIGETMEVWTELNSRFEDPKCFVDLPRHGRVLFLGGGWFICGLCETFRAGDAALRYAQKLDATGVMLHRVFAHQLRAVYYANRGFLAESARYRAHVETHAMQVGSAWQVEIWECGVMLLVNLTVADVVGVKRIAERLQVLSQEIPALANLALQAKAAHQFVLGDFAAAVETYDRALATDDPLGLLGWTTAMPFRAMALNQLGQFARAKSDCEAGLLRLSAADRTFVMRNVWMDIALSLAQSGLGEFEEAAERLDRVIAGGGAHDNPLVLGSLHHARACVAHAARDQKAFEIHLERTRYWFGETHTPTLVSRYEQLASLDLSGAFNGKKGSVSDHAALQLEGMLSGCENSEIRAQRALEAILKMTNSQRGVLFRIEDGVLDPIACGGGADPPREVRDSILRFVQQADKTVTTQTGDEHDAVRSPSLFPKLGGYHSFLLTRYRGGELVPIGAVALAEAPEFIPPGFSSLEAIAKGLSPASEQQTQKERV